MDDEYAKPRDVETDLAEITSRLGEPDAMHRTNPRSVAWRFVLGVLIVLAAATLHYLMWSGAVPWPKGVKLWMLLLAAMFVGPGGRPLPDYFCRPRAEAVGACVSDRVVRLASRTGGELPVG